MDPTAVDTSRNATEDVYLHVKPGKTRAPLLRYFRFNLPRLTRAVLLLVIAGIGATALTVGLSDHLPFQFAQIPLFLIAGVALVMVVVGAVTSWRIWDLGLFIAVAALLVYVGGIFADAPYVWNGATIPQAAVWNLMMIMSLVYLVAYWALNYGMIVAHPDNQNFQD